MLRSARLAIFFLQVGKTYLPTFGRSKKFPFFKTMVSQLYPAQECNHDFVAEGVTEERQTTKTPNQVLKAELSRALGGHLKRYHPHCLGAKRKF